MKIIHVTPTYFNDGSFIGGGERYPLELASRMADFYQTTLVSFSTKRQTYYRDRLKVEIYPVRYLLDGVKANPLSFQYLSALLTADIIHFHQVNTMVSDIGCLLMRLLGKHIYVTDHGGGGGIVLNRKLPIFSLYHHAIAQSQFAIPRLPIDLQPKAVLIPGGVDMAKFQPDSTLDRKKNILYVGRIVPHKGIDYLIEGFRLFNSGEFTLKIMGRVYDLTYFDELKQLAQHLPVEFIQDANDQQLLQAYQTAWVTVLPSVHTNRYGSYSPVPELMGMTLIEAQACGSPVICTTAGAMHEFVSEAQTGYVVAENSPEAIATALARVADLWELGRVFCEQRCRNWVSAFSWETVVQQHLKLYKKANNNERSR